MIIRYSGSIKRSFGDCTSRGIGLRLSASHRNCKSAIEYRSALKSSIFILRKKLNYSVRSREIRAMGSAAPTVRCCCWHLMRGTKLYFHGNWCMYYLCLCENGSMYWCDEYLQQAGKVAERDYEQLVLKLFEIEVRMLFFFSLVEDSVSSRSMN